MVSPIPINGLLFDNGLFRDGIQFGARWNVSRSLFLHWDSYLLQAGLSCFTLRYIDGTKTFYLPSDQVKFDAPLRTFLQWPFIGCFIVASLILLIASMVLGVVCLMNFGKGLAQYCMSDVLIVLNISPIFHPKCTLRMRWRRPTFSMKYFLMKKKRWNEKISFNLAVLGTVYTLGRVAWYLSFSAYEPLRLLSRCCVISFDAGLSSYIFRIPVSVSPRFWMSCTYVVLTLSL